MNIIHQGNILIHILAGTIALIAGFAAIISIKGGKLHRRSGKYFMRTVIIVIITGLIGVFIFNRNNFLLVVTLLSGYTCFSGIRAIRLQGKKPGVYDLIVPIIVMASALYYLYHITTIGLFWAPAVVYPTIGALFIITIYDLTKMFLSRVFLTKAMMYEHVYKMVSSMIAITSAFTGTVLPQYKPYSQLLPSLFGFVYIFIIFIRLSKKTGAGKLSVSDGHKSADSAQNRNHQ